MAAAAHEKGRLTSLDAIRGVCAILVAAMHTSFLTNHHILPSAYLVVDIFFAMSGYVIAHAYEAKLRSGGYLPTYIYRRYARLLPMWAIGLAVGAGFGILQHPHWHQAAWPTTALVLGLLFLPTWGGNGLFPFNPPGWSLFYELIANFAFGVVARWLKTSVLVGILAVAAPLLVAAILHAGSADGGRTWSEAGIAFARVAFSFSLGLLFYKLRLRLSGGDWHWAILWVGIFVLTALCNASPSPAMRPLFDSVFILIGCPAILMLGLNASSGSARLAEGLGALSYPLYAIHFAVMMVIRTGYQYAGSYTTPWLSSGFAAIILIGLIALAYWLGHRVDPRVQKFAARLVGQRPVQVPDTDVLKER